MSAAFTQDTEETPVVFRKYGARKGGEIIALFPTVLGTYDPYTCSSYVHVGQHGSADPRHVVNDTRPASPAEYEDLKRELEGAPFGYRLKICRRLEPRFLEARKAEGSTAS